MAQLARHHIPNPTQATQAILELHDTAAILLDDSDNGFEVRRKNFSCELDDWWINKQNN